MTLQQVSRRLTNASQHHSVASARRQLAALSVHKKPAARFHKQAHYAHNNRVAWTNTRHSRCGTPPLRTNHDTETVAECSIETRHLDISQGTAKLHHTKAHPSRHETTRSKLIKKDEEENPRELSFSAAPRHSQLTTIKRKKKRSTTKRSLTSTPIPRSGHGRCHLYFRAFEGRRYRVLVASANLARGWLAPLIESGCVIAPVWNMTRRHRP